MSSNLHPIMAQALAIWMPKAPPAPVECAQAATETVAPPMAEQLADEYATGLDAVDLPDNWEPNQ